MEQWPVEYVTGKRNLLNLRRPVQTSKGYFMNKLSDIGSELDPVSTQKRLHWPAPERNKEPILQVLLSNLPQTLGHNGTVLEIGAGTGQHSTYFARKFATSVWQATDPEPLHLKSIQAWIDWSNLLNMPKPLYLDTQKKPWPIRVADAIVCVNMIHVSPWASCTSLFEGAAEILSPNGIIYLYGPFSVGGNYTSQSNAAFHESLKSQNPAWGVRDLDDVKAVAVKYGFRKCETVEMPANNLSVFFGRTN